MVVEPCNPSGSSATERQSSAASALAAGVTHSRGGGPGVGWRRAGATVAAHSTPAALARQGKSDPPYPAFLSMTAPLVNVTLSIPHCHC
jgi:hypothetical protein